MCTRNDTTLTVTINGRTDGTANIVPVDGHLEAVGHATVFEQGLTSDGDTSETITGAITITAPDGLASITVGGTTLTLAQLNALTALAPAIMPSPMGPQPATTTVSSNVICARSTACSGRAAIRAG